MADVGDNSSGGSDEGYIPSYEAPTAPIPVVPAADGSGIGSRVPRGFPIGDGEETPLVSRTKRPGPFPPPYESAAAQGAAAGQDDGVDDPTPPFGRPQVWESRGPGTVPFRQVGGASRPWSERAGAPGATERRAGASGAADVESPSAPADPPGTAKPSTPAGPVGAARPSAAVGPVGARRTSALAGLAGAGDRPGAPDAGGRRGGPVPAGAPGASGVGPAGVASPSGMPGAATPPGAPGPVGVTGASGSAAPLGPAGRPGATGMPAPSGGLLARIGDIPIRVAYSLGAAVVTAVIVVLIFTLFSGDEPADPVVSSRADTSTASPPPVTLPDLPAATALKVLAGTPSTVIGTVTDSRSAITYSRLGKPWATKKAAPSRPPSRRVRTACRAR